ncbi:hypothetical protein [Magnetofaba australis]|uniref:Uncharacterized protein n=1 Tax=Magnetofaba australis IT-1 TaxID=1434232 RepID=A0A1Y2K973_9PROT|nr:hypothetical protein [Magnetofaba australis]OSM07026.1 hypothetical protein MAIT1_00068 [Magnetofaba australis IT-1]
MNEFHALQSVRISTQILADELKRHMERTVDPANSVISDDAASYLQQALTRLETAVSLIRAEEIYAESQCSPDAASAKPKALDRTVARLALANIASDFDGMALQPPLPQS